MTHECSQCTFVLDTDFLIAYFVTKVQRESATKKPVFVGMFTMNNWAGHSGFYLFKCPHCDEVRIDYPHGYCDKGHLYIRCGRCDFRTVFYPGKNRDVYQREGVVPPPTFWQELRYILKLRFSREEGKRIRSMREAVEKIEEHGVRVAVAPNIEDQRRA